MNGLPEPLWYSVPAEYNNRSLSGLVVQVPVRNRIVPALVVDEYTRKPTNLAFDLKPIHAIEELPEDPHYLIFLKKLGDYYQIEPLHFIKRIHHFLIDKKENTEIIELEKKYSTQNTVTLTDEQQKVCDFITPHIGAQYAPILLHGVTGSGKTECYKHIFLDALSKNKTSLLLLPEVTLAIAFENRLKAELA